MTIARWTPPVAPTRQEQFLLKRLDRVRKLLGFLRLHRHELFDDAFQDELAADVPHDGCRERGASARDDGHGDARAGIPGDFRRRDDRVDGRRFAGADGAGVLGGRGAAVFARRVAGVSRAADRRRPGSARARTHRRVGEGHARRSIPQAAQDPARGDRFESLGGRGTGRRHVQLAGPCGAQCGELCRRPARVDRRTGVPSGGHSPARGVEHQARARHRLERCGREARGDHDLLAATRLAAVVDRTPAARGPREAAAQGAGRDPRADPDAGSGTRSARRWGRAFARAWPRIDGSRSRTRRCVTAARARASGSMDSSGTLPRTSIAG